MNKNEQYIRNNNIYPPGTVQNMNIVRNTPNTQLSGIAPTEYSTFKQQHISRPQEKFIMNNASFVPSSMFKHTDNNNSSNLENRLALPQLQIP